MTRTAVAAAWAAIAVLATAPAPESSAAPAAEPRIDAVTPLVQLEETAELCVCGSFPSAAAARALRVDGRPVELAGPFDARVSTVRLPPGLAPGTHTLTGAPEGGYGSEDQREFRLVAINTKICHPLPFGPRRRVHLMVAGTEEPVALRVRNLTPDSLALSGGPLQELATSGGRRNQKVLRAKVLQTPTVWNLNVALAAPRCPCTGNGGAGPERQEALSRDLERAVAAAEAWLRGRQPELRAAAARGTFSQEDGLRLLDDVERRLLEATAAPELAALRAWVEDRLAEERTRRLGTPEPDRSRTPPRRPRLSAVAYPTPPADTGAVPTAALDGLFDRLFSLFRSLRDVSRDLVVDLCVRSSPPRSEVWVQPKRYQPGRRTELTNTEFENLTRGLYVGHVEKPGEAPADFEVDLVREARIYVDCNLADGLCDRPPRPVGFSCREPGDRN